MHQGQKISPLERWNNAGRGVAGKSRLRRQLPRSAMKNIILGTIPIAKSTEKRYQNRGNIRPKSGEGRGSVLATGRRKTLICCHQEGEGRR